MDKPFRMRHFDLVQGACAMRLSVDALFLGAWASSVVQDVRHILDIGTGTGILALMLAQHYSEAKVTAIDIDSEAVRTAQRNFANSPYSNRLTALQCDITASKLELPYDYYDLIISNPPYYDGLKPSSTALCQARHTSEGFAPHRLFHYLESLTTVSPTLCLITPVGALPALRRNAVLHRYNLTQLCWLHHRLEQPAIRILTQWHRADTPPPSCFSEKLVIRTTQQSYSDEARDLLYPYLLDQYLV